MRKLPENLVKHATLIWQAADAERARQAYDGRDITVVTAFFDLGRGDWKVQGGKASPFQRSLENYFGYFAHLARLKNPMVIFVAPEHAQRVLGLRKLSGMENFTTVFTIANLFENEEIKGLLSEVESKMTPTFQNWVRFPNVPEFTQPRYAVLDALKSVFVNSAIAAGVVSTEQVAWLDFGYARDENCFDAAKPWRFDAGGKINMFHMRPIDDTPVFKVVQRGYVFFQGGCKIGPAAAWPAFSAGIDQALDGLLTSDLVDDEQTLLLMAWRANPDAYRIYPMDPRDWRVAIRFFNEERRGEDVKFRDHQFVGALRKRYLGKAIRAIAAGIARRAEKFS